MSVSNSWIEIDKVGLQRTLERKGKAWMVFELVQNAYDTDATQVDVTLTKPNKNGRSTLTCTDNSKDGYRNLSEAHTLFGSSMKKADPNMRGRFNAGEKFVIVMCDSAKVTSTTGQIVFMSNGKRKENPDVKTDSGTVFEGTMELIEEEWVEVGRQVSLLFPPIQTVYNGTIIPPRVPVKTFQETLPTEVANERGVLSPRKRKTEVRIYAPEVGETPMLYERGIPVVEIESKYHVSVEQKIPLNADRDNVTPSYMRNIYAIVAEHMADSLTQEDTVQPWARAALETGKLSDEATKKIAVTRFGESAVLYDGSDIGSNKEAVSKGANLINRGSVSTEEREVFYKTGAIKKAGEIDDYKTNLDNKAAKKTLTPDEHDDDTKKFVKLIEVVSPILINHAVTVKVVDDSNFKVMGCTRWKKDSFIFEINLAHQDVHDWTSNYDLLIHELAHHKVQSNDHLCREFYDSVTNIGAKLAILAQLEPELFPEANEYLDLVEFGDLRKEVA